MGGGWGLGLMSPFARRRGTAHPRATLPATNLFARFIAGQGITTSGGRVSQWNDQAATNHATEAVTANQPYDTTDYLGRPIVRFAGSSNTGLAFAAAHSFNAQNIAVFMAARLHGGSNQALFGLLNYAGNQPHLRLTGTPVNFSIMARSTNFRPRLNPALWGGVAGASTTGYTNYESITGLAAVTADTDCAGATIGRFNAGSYLGADVYEVAVYEGALTAQQITDIRRYFNAKYTLRSTNYTKNIVFEGDSITAGSGLAQGQSYPFQVLRAGCEDWRICNLSLSGSTVATMTTRANSNATDPFIESGYARNVLVVLIGRNDVTAVDNSATIYTNLVSYVQARVTAGWEVWVGTCIASGSTIQGTINNFNDRIRGVIGNGIITDASASRVVDYGALPQFDTSTDSSNVTYYQGDNTHPTAAGAALLANTVAPYLT
jgi:lysophospholipase L1-like esterase